MLYNHDYTYLFKIVLAGNTYVGKTSIADNFVDNIFKKNTDTTIGVDFKSRIFQVDNIKFKIQIWDTAGQEKFRSICKSYYRCGDAILLVFDLSNYETFYDLRFWLQDISSGNPDASVFIIGNKADLPNKVVKKEDIDEFINENNLNYIECSAKTSDNIDNIFEQVIRNLYNKYKDDDTLEDKMNKSLLIKDEKRDKCFKGCC
jgi:small GTP-binding protein